MVDTTVVELEARDETCRPVTAPEFPIDRGIAVPYPPREIYNQMFKFLVLVVDFSEAVLLGEETPLTFQALKSGIAEALGVDAEIKLVEMIISSYTGLSRIPIETDSDLCEFYDNVQCETSGNEKTPSKTDLMIRQLKDEYETIIAGHLRRIDELQMEKNALETRVSEMEEDLGGLTAQYSTKLTAAEKDITKRVKGEFKEKMKAFEAEVAQKEKEFKTQLKQRGEQLAAQRREIGEVRKELQEVQEGLKYNESLVEENTKIIADRDARIEELLDECERLKQEHGHGETHATLCPSHLGELSGGGGSRRGSLSALRSSSRRSSKVSEASRRSSLASTKATEKRSRFTFTVPSISDKIQRYQKGRPYLSEEVTDLTGLDFAQVEFFPNGDVTSRNGWCAIKMRVPNRTKIRWSVSIGRQHKGPRVDVFEESLWWCRYGLLWANFCQISKLLGEVTDDKDELAVTVEIHSARVVEDDEPSDEESTASSQSLPGRCLACGKELNHGLQEAPQVIAEVKALFTLTLRGDVYRVQLKPIPICITVTSISPEVQERQCSSIVVKTVGLTLRPVLDYIAILSTSERLIQEIQQQVREAEQELHMRHALFEHRASEVETRLKIVERQAEEAMSHLELTLEKLTKRGPRSVGEATESLNADIRDSVEWYCRHRGGIVSLDPSEAIRHASSDEHGHAIRATDFNDTAVEEMLAAKYPLPVILPMDEGHHALDAFHIPQLFILEEQHEQLLPSARGQDDDLEGLRIGGLHL
ncbi:hypothetical protein FOL47_002062 [Perkinsus chesapeaki]|uniref:Uncharacterized protein n=1 Tax=Perkinsus chesapeaki TaxID=330153 RepID=A0A7J6MFW8_PERCH|nr:hypothetical protein FOL47_002062 [Perkinsus chesapeaki]